MQSYVHFLSNKITTLKEICKQLKGRYPGDLTYSDDKVVLALYRGSKDIYWKDLFYVKIIPNRGLC